MTGSMVPAAPVPQPFSALPLLLTEPAREWLAKISRLAKW